MIPLPELACTERLVSLRCPELVEGSNHAEVSKATATTAFDKLRQHFDKLRQHFGKLSASDSWYIYFWK
jgi:hypothetical protein